MISGISFSRFGSSRRSERPTQPRGCTDTGQLEYSDNTMAETNSQSPLSFISVLSHRLMRASSFSSSKRNAPSRRDILRRCSSDLTRTTIPVDVKESNAVPVHDGRPCSARESKQGQPPKVQKATVLDRSLLPQGQSNFHVHRRRTHSSVNELFDKPSYADSGLPPIVAEAKGNHSLSPPDFQLPSEEAQRLRRLEKVRRILGEGIPPELICRSGTQRIMNINVFPDPPSPAQNDTIPRREQPGKQLIKPLSLARRASLNTSSFPTFTTVSTSLLPVKHALGELQERRDMNRETDAHPARPGPRTFSPFVFTKDVTLPRARTSQVVAKSKWRSATAESSFHSPSQQTTDMEVSNLPRWPSLNGSTITSISPSIPALDSQNDRPSIMEPTPEDSHFPPSPSTQLSMKFSEPPEFRLIIGDDDGLEDESSSSEPHTPPSARVPTRRIRTRIYAYYCALVRKHRLLIVWCRRG